MDRSSLTFRTLKNVAYNFLAYAWPFLFSVIITPIIIAKLGIQQYGIYIFINTVSSFISIITSGFSGSSTKYISEYNGRNDRASLRKLFNTMNVIFLLIALVGTATIMAGLFIGNALSIASSISFRSLLLFFSLVSASYFIQTSTTLYQAIPVAMERFDISSKISIFTGTLGSLGNLALVLMGYGIGALFAWQLFTAVIMVSISIGISLRLVPESSYRLEFDRAESKKHAIFGSLSAFDNLARTSLFSLDRILIPIFTGVSNLTYYSLPGNVSMRIPGTADVLAGTIFPTSSNLQAAGHHEKVSAMYVRSTRLLSLVSLAITTAIIIYADSIMRYWLGESFAIHSTNILIILAVTCFIISLLSPVASFLMGTKRVKFNTGLSVTMALLNIVFLIILLPRFGITGAAWAYLISVLPIFYAIYVVENKFLHLQDRLRYYRKYCAKNLAVIASIAVISFFVKPFATSFVSLAFIGPLTVLSYIGLYILYGFIDKEDYRDIRTFIRTFWHNKVSSKIKVDLNKQQKRKQDIKMAIRGMLPKFVLKLIRRRQVPLKKMEDFLAENRGNAIHTNTKAGSIAVIMSCYQHERYLGEALESIIRQTQMPNEIIVINNGALDHTKDILSSFFSSDRPWMKQTKAIVLEERDNIGQAAALNRCIQTATSDLIMIMNDDDALMRDIVERTMEIFKENPYLSFIGGSNINISSSRQIDPQREAGALGSFHKAMIVRRPEDAIKYENYCDFNVTHSGSSFSREKAMSCGLFLPKKKRIVKFSDRDFQIRLNLMYPVASFEPIPFCFWRTDSSVDSGKNS